MYLLLFFLGEGVQYKNWSETCTLGHTEQDLPSKSMWVQYKQGCRHALSCIINSDGRKYSYRGRGRRVIGTFLHFPEKICIDTHARARARLRMLAWLGYFFRQSRARELPKWNAYANKTILHDNAYY